MASEGWRKFIGWVTAIGTLDLATIKVFNWDFIQMVLGWFQQGPTSGITMVVFLALGGLAIWEGLKLSGIKFK